MRRSIMEQTVVGLFDNLEDAHKVVTELVKAGFDRGNISLVANDASQNYSKYMNKDKASSDADEDVSSGEGASFGAVVGGLMGAIAGLGALAIPGVGPVLAAGPLL